jgi:hypothetical protein
MDARLVFDFADIPPIQPYGGVQEQVLVLTLRALPSAQGRPITEADVVVWLPGPAKITGLWEPGGAVAPLAGPGQEARIRLLGWAAHTRQVCVRLTLPVVEPNTLLGRVWLIDPTASAGAEVLAVTSVTTRPWVSAEPEPAEYEEISPPKPIRDPLVNTGFALARTPSQPLSTDYALAAGGDYLFWLDIQRFVEDSIESKTIPLPPGLPTGTVLTVALFGQPDGIGIDPDRAIGRLTLRSNGTAFVSYQPFHVDSAAAAERLFFPVTAPNRSGTARLWCYVYWRQLLLQTRLIEAEVATSSILAPHALTSTVDYRIADPIDALAAPRQPEHTASLFVDSNVVRVMATDGSQLLRAQSSIEEESFADQIRLARGALSRVAWGSEEPWQPGMDYRYEHQPSVEQITQDLILLAVNGYRLHHLLLASLGRGSGVDSYPMTELVGNALRRPGFVQLATRKSAVPAALIYDLPLDSNATNIRLCTDFVASAQKNELFGSACLTGACTQATDPDPEVVCPGGFWGFRHALGMPLSAGNAPAVPMALPYDGGLGLVGGVYQDFASTENHLAALRDLVPWKEYRLGRDRLATLEALSGGQPQIVYFYCQGGVSGDQPYVRAGRDADPVITQDNLRRRRVRWPRSRPLVFLNNCRTSGLSPEQAIEFASFFVEQAWASGVIGTEITVFEPLADAFARECLRAFLVDGEAIGAAVTRARISLLAGGNPLGLAYIPYVLPALALER